VIKGDCLSCLFISAIQAPWGMGLDDELRTSQSLCHVTSASRAFCLIIGDNCGLQALLARCILR
jgi:hypothetical protein